MGGGDVDIEPWLLTVNRAGAAHAGRQTAHIPVGDPSRPPGG